MKKAYLIFLLVAIITVTVFGTTFVLGSENSAEEENYSIRVVSTIPTQLEFARAIGGEKVKVSSMIPPGEEPHGYTPVSSQLRDLSKADLYFKVGSGVEFERRWMDTILEKNPDMKVVDGSEGISLIGMGSQNGQDKAESGEYKTDPHVWLSLNNAKIMVRNLLKGMKNVDPNNASYYERNAESYLDNLNELDREISEGLSSYRNRGFIIYHPGFGYFAHDYDLEQIPVEKSGKKPGPQRIQYIIEKAREENIKTVFVSPQFDKTQVEVIVDEIDGEIKVLNPLPEKYYVNMQEVYQKIKNSFESSG